MRRGNIYINIKGFRKRSACAHCDAWFVLWWGCMAVCELQLTNGASTRPLWTPQPGAAKSRGGLSPSATQGLPGRKRSQLCQLRGIAVSCLPSRCMPTRHRSAQNHVPPFKQFRFLKSLYLHPQIFYLLSRRNSKF